MNQQLLDIILQDALTLHQAYKYIRVLKEYITAKIFGSEHPLSPEDLQWVQQIDPTLLQQYTKENIEESFQTLLSDIEKYPVLVVYFATAPDNELLRNINLWIKTNIDKKVVLDVKLDPNLIAGCAFVWNGSYKDYSMRSKIEDNKQEILAYLSQTIHKT